MGRESNQGGNQGRGNQGGSQRGSSSSRGFGNMDDDEQRRIAEKGGETSARVQNRDDQGQFTGTGSRSGGNSGGDNSGGGSRGGNSGGGNSGGGNSGGGSNR